MSNGTSVAPEGMPTHPTRTIVNGVPPGPVAESLVDRYQAQLRRFHQAQQQNVTNGGEASAVYRAFRDLGGAQATYTNIMGQETVTLDIHPGTVREEEERQREPDYWKWCLFELVIANMVGFECFFDATSLTGGATCRVADANGMPDDREPPEVEDTSFTLSVLVDMQNAGGQIVEVELRGQLRSKFIEGGPGDFQGQLGTAVNSVFYGSQTIAQGANDGISIPGPFAPAALLSAPLYNRLDLAFSGNEANALELLAYTFPSWAGVVTYTVSFPPDHRQDIDWLANWFIDDFPTRWTFWTGDIATTVGPRGVDPNTYAVLPYGIAPTITYWDPGTDLHKKTEVYLGYETPFGPTMPVPAVGSVQQWTAQYLRGTDFYVPTWRYDDPRTATLSAVCAKANTWSQVSKRRAEGETLPGEDDPTFVESYRWETGSFPSRPNMALVEGAVPIAVEDDEELLLIGTLKIDTNSGKVTFVAGGGG